MYSSPLYYNANNTIICNDKEQNLRSFKVDGTRQWSVYYGPPGLVGQSNGISAPCLYKGKVYVARNDKTIKCYLGANGSLVWSVQVNQKLGPYNLGSICAYNDMVFAASENTGGIYALSATDGHGIWTAYPGTYTRIAHLTANYGKLFVVDGSRLCCLNAVSGSTVWTLPDVNSYSNPVVADNKVFIVKYISGVSTLLALDVETGHEMWRKSGFGNFADGSIMYAVGLIFYLDITGADQTTVYAINGVTGATVWSTTLPETGHFATSSAVVTTTAGNTIYPTQSGLHN
jgi:hypothetical protein